MAGTSTIHVHGVACLWRQEKRSCAHAVAVFICILLTCGNGGRTGRLCVIADNKDVSKRSSPLLHWKSPATNSSFPGFIQKRDLSRMAS